MRNEEEIWEKLDAIDHDQWDELREINVQPHQVCILACETRFSTRFDGCYTATTMTVKARVTDRVSRRVWA